jgi:hypothetical protein
LVANKYIVQYTKDETIGDMPCGTCWCTRKACVVTALQIDLCFDGFKGSIQPIGTSRGLLLAVNNVGGVTKDLDSFASNSNNTRAFFAQPSCREE